MAPPPPPRAPPALLVLAAAALAALAALAGASMTPEQITGNYELARFCPTCNTACPEQLYVRAAEVLTVQNGTLYVVAHSNIYFRRFATDPGLQCAATGVSSTAGLKVSSTLLRRMDEVTVDRSLDILAAFYNSPNDVFFLGYEVGTRTCGAHRTPSGIVSLWAVPSATVRGSHNGRSITFQPGVKYLYYFDPDEPCLYEGNAAEAGVATAVDAAASAVSDPSSVSPGGTVAGPDGSPIGTVTGEGTIITSAGAVPADGAPAAPAPAPAPDPTANTDSNSGYTARDNPECLPGTALLSSADGTRLALADARVGDVVATGRDAVSGRLLHAAIYAFSHADAAASPARPLVALDTAANASVALTEGHLVPVRDVRGSGAAEELVPARDVRAGRHALFVVSAGAWVPVVAAGRAAGAGAGLFNPHTRAGTIVVNGVVVSCYTTAVGRRKADALLGAAQVAYGVFGARGARGVAAVADLWRTAERLWRRLQRDGTCRSRGGPAGEGRARWLRTAAWTL
jgi:hypothetical protein